MDFARANHLYQSDLDILGEGSLFELLSTTRSEVGAERLACYLLDPPTLAEARARQEAVKELRGATGLREEVALLGKYQFQECRGGHLREWLRLPALKTHPIVPALLLCSSIAVLALGVCGYAQAASWMQVAPALIALLAMQAAIGSALMRQVRPNIKALVALGGDVALIRQGVRLMERQRFDSGKLSKLVERLQQRSASVCIRKLERLIDAVSRREDLLLYGFGLWLALGTQLVLAIEKWRAEHQSHFEDWLDVWSEFEALNALAGYAFEHPENVFPELVDGQARYESTGLGHPLIPRERCVGNDVALNEQNAFYVISGSNMAGKSTFLRAIGLNAVLALAGAPVRAFTARISPFHICASISIADSFQERRSKFLAEVDRLRETICTAKAGVPVLFLIDEILSGTNSRDRRIAAESVIQTLVASGAVGALSTHDLALTEIADVAGLRGVNVHMESEEPDRPLAFDYRVKPGIMKQANALAIVRMMGIGV
jgi:DNA mismatch repair ATPase MutS